MIPRFSHHYMTKSTRYDFSVTKPRGTIDTDINHPHIASKYPKKYSAAKSIGTLDS